MVINLPPVRVVPTGDLPLVPGADCLMRPPSWPRRLLSAYKTPLSPQSRRDLVCSTPAGYPGHLSPALPIVLAPSGHRVVRALRAAVLLLNKYRSCGVRKCSMFRFHPLRSARARRPLYSTTPIWPPQLHPLLGHCEHFLGLGQAEFRPRG